MRQIAIYGKGGIGKSMVSSHLSFAFAQRGMNVMHVGCDPKHDSTRLLLEGRMPVTILDVLRKVDFDLARTSLEELVVLSPLSGACKGRIYCAESGGPDPGVGCGGKGVIEAVEALNRFRAFELLGLDLVLYDVLGDVVCGGFAMPIREGYAREIYVVTSGEIEALFAACNIFRAVARFSAKSGARLGGLIGNSRRMAGEQELLRRFAEFTGASLVGFIPYSERIKAASGKGGTVFQHAPDSEEAAAFGRLAETVEHNKDLRVPRPFSFDDLHAWWVENRCR